MPHDVQAVGKRVTAVAPGDFVVLNWRAGCGNSRTCDRGEPWYCFATHNATQKMTLADGTELSQHSASAPSPRRPSSPQASSPRWIPRPAARFRVRKWPLSTLWARPKIHARISARAGS